MPYTLPNFNLQFQAKANFNFALGINPVGPFILANTPCNLAYGRRQHNRGPDTIYPGGQEFMTLLLPLGIGLKGKGSYAVKNGDAVEVPMGTGRWYSVMTIDRVAAGFTNEHQAALIVQPYVVSVAAPLWP